MTEVSEQSQCIGRRKDPILIYPRAFISSSGNQPECGCKWVSKGALCVIQWAMSSRGQTKLSEWPFLTLKSASVSLSSSRLFCSVLLMSKAVVQIWVMKGPCVCTYGQPDMFHFENPSHACCGSGWKCVCLRGETRFVEVAASSCAGHNQKRAHVMSCHVMSWVWGHILTAAWPLRLEKGQGRPCVQQGGLTG